MVLFLMHWAHVKQTLTVQRLMYPFTPAIKPIQHVRLYKVPL